MKLDNVFVSCPYPKYVGPFHGDVTRFENINKKYDLGFHVLNTDYYLEIANMLGTRANSGTLTILDLLCYDLKELHITGFTWFRDGWRKSYKKLSDDKFKKVSDEVKSEFNGNHKQKPQEDLVREIYLNDNRVSIDNVMKEILEVE
jgi:ribosomal protein L20A (L18A)